MLPSAIVNNAVRVSIAEKTEVLLRPITSPLLHIETPFQSLNGKKLNGLLRTQLQQRKIENVTDKANLKII